MNILDLSRVTDENEAAVAIHTFADELLYGNYTFNRQQAPDITPERWKKIYGEQAVEWMERRLQDELYPKGWPFK